MPLFKFTANTVLEASSEEDALRQLASRLSTIARHVGGEVPLADNGPFFTLAQVEKGTAVDLKADPVVERQRAEAEAAEKGEAQTIASSDVGEMPAEIVAAAQGGAK